MSDTYPIDDRAWTAEDVATYRRVHWEYATGGPGDPMSELVDLRAELRRLHRELQQAALQMRVRDPDLLGMRIESERRLNAARAARLDAERSTDASDLLDLISAMDSVG